MSDSDGTSMSAHSLSFLIDMEVDDNKKQVEARDYYFLFPKVGFNLMFHVLRRLLHGILNYFMEAIFIGGQLSRIPHPPTAHDKESSKR